MSAEHHVDVSAVQGLAETFAGQEPKLSGLGGPLQQSAGGVHTGAADLDAQTRTAVGRIAELLTRIGAEFGRTAQDIRDVATELQEFHQQVAEDQRQVVSALPDAGEIG